VPSRSWEVKMRTRSMLKPTVHLNGTSRGELERLHEQAFHKLGEAIDSLLEAAPNGRDFYTQGDSAYAEARKEHEARVARVRSVRGEIEELWLHIVDHP
jgi:hypothetical protein